MELRAGAAQAAGLGLKRDAIAHASSREKRFSFAMFDRFQMEDALAEVEASLRALAFIDYPKADVKRIAKEGLHECHKAQQILEELKNMRLIPREKPPEEISPEKDGPRDGDGHRGGDSDSKAA